MALVRGITLDEVIERKGRSKRVPPEALAHFAAELRRVVEDRYAGNQTRAAKGLDCTQGHISAMLLGNRGPGLNTLMAMRDITGRSIDSLLGLPPTPADAMIQQLRESVEAHLQTQLTVKEATLDRVKQLEDEQRARRVKRDG